MSNQTCPLGALAKVPAPRMSLEVDIVGLSYGDWGLEEANLLAHSHAALDNLTSDEHTLLIFVLRNKAVAIAAKAMDLADIGHADEILKLRITLHPSDIEVNPIGADFIHHIRTCTPCNPLCGHCSGHPATHYDNTGLPTCELCPVDDTMLR